MSEYIHVTYDCAYAILRDADGTLRYATPEELMEVLHAPKK